MPRPDLKIVLSYRRKDAEGTTGRIFDRLVQHYGKNSVFMDVDGITSGTNFHERINSALNDCDVLLAVIGSRWIGQRKGKPSRIKEEADCVRVEVEIAIRRGILVIPILVGGATMPRRDQLPETLHVLLRHQSAIVHESRDFHSHIDRLIEDIELLLPTASAMSKVAPELADPAPLAENYLKMIDRGDLEVAYYALDADARQKMAPTSDRFRQLVDVARTPLGTVESRALLGVTAADNPQGYPPGFFRFLSFKTKFLAFEGYRIEVVTVRFRNDHDWAVYTYQIYPQVVPD